jgi:hypothetical protein
MPDFLKIAVLDYKIMTERYLNHEKETTQINMIM